MQPLEVHDAGASLHRDTFCSFFLSRLYFLCLLSLTVLYFLFALSSFVSDSVFVFLSFALSRFVYFLFFSISLSCPFSFSLFLSHFSLSVSRPFFIPPLSLSLSYSLVCLRASGSARCDVLFLLYSLAVLLFLSFTVHSLLSHSALLCDKNKGQRNRTPGFIDRSAPCRISGWSVM